MRVSGNAIRLAALVAAATTSGYLWRAALESPQGSTVIRLAPSATPHVHVIAAPHDPISGAPTKAAQHQHAPPTQLAATRVAAPSPTTQSAQHSQPTTPPHPSNPSPKPSAPKPAPPPAPKPPQPSPTPTPTTSQPPPTSSPPVASSPPPAQSSPPPTETPDESKPGWGNGDKNHHHDGPPGKHG